MADRKCLDCGIIIPSYTKLCEECWKEAFNKKLEEE